MPLKLLSGAVFLCLMIPQTSKVLRLLVEGFREHKVLLFH
ncbi:hypothetical protein J2T12_002200 [Paenibacillus anaericanus]|nr:hypothetical protein [Paenibacillus anaericanus]